VTRQVHEKASAAITHASASLDAALADFEGLSNYLLGRQKK
jgi:hypothetical protein